MYLKIGIIVALCGLSSLFFFGESEPPSFKDYWYNQGAEMTRYELKQMRYGEERDGEAVFIYVTEPFHKTEQVKSDNPQDPNALPILKLNALRSFNTGIYRYSVMRSIFQPTQIELHSHALKATCSVQEWCGHVFEQLNRQNNGWRFQLHSYFQSEGEQDLKLENAYLEDAFWTMLRLNPKMLPLGEQQLIPSSIWRRFSHTPVSVEAAVVSLKEEASVSTLSISYKNIQREISIEFDTAFPHTIHAWTETSGQEKTSARMTHRSFGPYWKWNTNEHLDKREELGLH